jgi:hypothetical protein
MNLKHYFSSVTKILSNVSSSLPYNHPMNRKCCQNAVFCVHMASIRLQKNSSIEIPKPLNIRTMLE